LFSITLLDQRYNQGECRGTWRTEWFT